MQTRADMATFLKTNALGKLYYNGKSLGEEDRAEVMKLFKSGLSYGEISKKCGVMKAGCRKIVKRAVELQSLQSRKSCGRKATVTNDEVIRFIHYQKMKSPSIYTGELQKKLLESGVSRDDNLPSLTAIRRIIRDELIMTRKLVQPMPSEGQTERVNLLVDNYISTISTYKPEQIHFFDECSIIRTAGNRRFGHSLYGTPAYEVQRYSSNATFTVNLLCGFFEIDYVDVLNGASNAMEMLNFFQQAVAEKNSFGNAALGRGDVVVMDNCGFHHHRVIEGQLRNLLAQHGVTLVFQPPYSPEFNVCEYVFRLMRSELQKSPTLTSNFTELAIVRALTKINPSIFRNLYHKCGYV